MINELVDEIFDSPLARPKKRRPIKLDKYSPDQARDHLGRWVTSLAGRAANEAVRLTRDEGGFTLGIAHEKFSHPTEGYALSLWPEHSLVLDAQALRGSGRTAAKRKLVSWIKANKELLAKPGMHIGGWHDTSSGKAYIDISVVYPQGQLDKALSHARKANQIAIWSLHDSEEIAVGGTGEALHKGVPSHSWPPSTASSSPPRGSPTTTRMRKTWPTPSSTPWGLTTTRSHQHLAELIDKFDPDQPRDAQGRWTVVGAGGYPKVDPDARTSGPWADMPHEERRAWDNVFRAWDDITRDDPHQDEPERVFPERYVDRREHFPNGVAGMVLRHGQVESRIRRSADGGAELYDVSPLAPGLTFDDIPKGAKVDMSGGEGGRPLVEVAGSARPPSFAYRLVAAEEWDQALARGYFQSDGRMNLGASEGTVMSSISTGSFYMPKSGQARIIRFHHDPAWKLDPNDSYIKTQSRIPLDRVDRVTGLIETQYLSKAAHHLGELLYKYNKNHDRVGRFASASGSGGSSEQPPGDWGSHPREWAKHTYEMQGDGWTTRVESDLVAAIVRGHFYSSDHKVMGSFERVIDAKSRTVTHEILVIKPEHQGKGIAEAFNAHAEEAYRAAGIDTIKLTANITVGGYAWAKAGYDWDRDGEDGARYDLEKLISVYQRNNGNTRALVEEDGHPIAPNFAKAESQDAIRMAVRAVARDHHAELVTPEVAAKAEELARIPGRLKPQDVARLGYDQGAVVRGADGRRYWLGKLLLLGSYWEGTKELRSLAMAKHNKNHDKLGRFARSSGGTATLERSTAPEGSWGSHPQEWAKHTFEMVGDGWHVTVDGPGSRASERQDGRISVFGKIWSTGTNQVIGEFHRLINPESNSVTHDLLVIEPERQGIGIAKAFNDHAEAAYIEAGLERINLHANISIGGYAWAKAGYNWKPNAYEAQTARRNLLALTSNRYRNTDIVAPYIEALGRSEWRIVHQLVEDHYHELVTPEVKAAARQLVQSGPISAQDVARLGHDQGAIVKASNGQRYWAGKLMMLGSDWHGHKKLSPKVAKFNRNHDEQGRFARASGSGATATLERPTMPTIGTPPEGNWDTHPHEWTKHTYEAKGDDWSTEASYAGNGMVYGSIFDTWGAQIGKFERRITGDVVDHHLLVIKSDFQGQGIAEAFNAHVEAAYRQAGIKEITLFANINVGGYAWAKAGYNWDKPGSNATLYDLIQLDDQYKSYGGHTHAATSQMCPMLSELRDDKPAIEKMLEEHHAELLTPAVAARVAQLVKPPEGSGGPLSALSTVVPFSAQEVAKLGYDEGAIVTAENGQRYWLGKLMLLGTQWHGSKKLQSPAMAKYDPSQPRDRRGRWSASGGRWGAAGALGSVAAPTDVGHDPQDDALLQTRRKMQAFATKMKPSKDWEERKAAIAELKQPKWYTNPDVVGRIGGRILQEAQDRTKWTLMAHSNFRKQIAQLHGEIANQSAKLPERMIESPKGVADLKADITKRQHRLKDLQDKSQRIDQLRFGDHVRAILAELHPMGGTLRVEAEDMPPGGDHTWAPARVVHAIESMVPSSWVEWANTSHQYPTSVTMTDRGGMAGAFATRNNHIMVSQHLSPAMQESTALHEFGHLMQLHPLVAEAETAYVHDRLGPTPRAVGAELTSGEVAYLMENPDKPWGNPYSGRLYEGPRKAMNAYGREKAEHRNTDGRSWNGGKRGILHEVLTTGLQHMLDPHDEQYDHDLAKWATGMLMLDIPAGDRRRTEG